MSGSGADFAAQVSVFISRHLTPQAQSAALAGAARAGLAELQASGELPEHVRRYVDGVQGAREDAVKPGGEIVYRADMLGEIVAFALGALMRLAPVRSGQYRESFAVIAAGRMIRARSFVPERLAGLRRVAIVNTQPYSRLIDVQIVGREPIRVMVPPDILRRAGAAVDSQFGNQVATSWTYNQRYPGQPTLKRDRSHGGTRIGKPVESPALIIEVR